jgi:precorrin-8X/cobalt-precorrin-8 methylmutase
VGLPVGFVGAAEAKDALRASGVRSVSNVSEKGGAAVAAAAFGALLAAAQELSRPSDGGRRDLPSGQVSDDRAAGGG